MSAQVVLLPGFGGSARQPILLAIERGLQQRCIRLAPPRLKLDPSLEAYVTWVENKLKKLEGPVFVVGRSFGGRLALRLAARRPVAGAVLLGFPVRPTRRLRPLDEAALVAMPAPTLIVQGSDDALGPLSVLEPLVRQNRTLWLEVLDGAGHDFGRQTSLAVARTIAWLRPRLDALSAER